MGSGDTNPFGPEIVLQGSSGTATQGLRLVSNNNHVFGLNIQRFSSHGINILGGDNNWVAGNYVGTDPTGTQSQAPEPGPSTAPTDNGSGLVFVETSGQVIVEAEDFLSRTPSVTGLNWTLVPDEDPGFPAEFTNFRGDGYIQSLPDASGNVGVSGARGENGGFVDYRIDITTTGQYRLIPRWDGFNFASNSIWASIVELSDGAGGSIADFYEFTDAADDSNFATSWDLNAGFESNVANVDGIRTDAVWDIVAAGTYTIRFVPREDGAALDAFAFQLAGLPTPGELLGNGGDGIRIGDGAQSNVIGTDGDGVADQAEGNLISGNARQFPHAGVRITGAGTDLNVVAGNIIGADVTGTQALPNRGTAGIFVKSAGNRIGTDGNGMGDEAERNIISGNDEDGIQLGFGGNQNEVFGNFIGTDVTGQSPLPNGDASNDQGIIIGGSSNEIGGPGVLGNTIAFNGGVGVLVAAGGTGNRIQGNSIHSNNDLGIGLGSIDNESVSDGVTPNDLGDLDTGPNNFQNFPVLSDAIAGSSVTRLVGTLNSLASTTFTIDVYASSEADPSGFGEGERFLGSVSVITDASGNASFDVTLAVGTIVGEVITATATEEPSGNTSEFSFALTIVNKAPSITSAAAVNAAENQTSVIDVQSSDPEGETEAGGGLTYSLTGGADQTLFSIDADTGVLTFDTAPDFENPGDDDTDNVYDVQVTVTDTGGLTDSQTISVSVLNEANVTGFVFADVDNDGEFDVEDAPLANIEITLIEAGLDGVVGTADDGETFITTTDNDGFYGFEDVAAGKVLIIESGAPADLADGVDTPNGAIDLDTVNDQFFIDLPRTDVNGMNFAEQADGGGLSSGDTATIGYWQNKNGQALIEKLDEDGALTAWLLGNFGNIFDQADFDEHDGSVGEFYKAEFFKKKLKGTPKVDAQFMAVAFATFATSSNLSSGGAVVFGFNVTDSGIGTTVVNVGSSGAAFGVADNTNMTILALLLATNDLTGFGADLVYDGAQDLDADGVVDDTSGSLGTLDDFEKVLRVLANQVYTDINEAGDI